MGNGYFRHPKTTQERRRWFYDKDVAYEYPELKLRNARNDKLLPHAWDDIWKTNDGPCWKAHRSTQYRIKKNKILRSAVRYSEAMKRRDRWWTQHKGCWHRPCNYCKKHDIIYCGRTYYGTMPYYYH